MEVQHGSGFPYEASDASSCQSAEELAGEPALRLSGLRGCARVPTTLTGFVPAESRTLVVVLGSGRELRVRARVTPFGRPERVVAATLPPGEAIRRVQAVDGAGRTLARAQARVAPPDRRCGEPTPIAPSWSITSERPRVRAGVPPGTQVAAADTSGARLLVRDFGVRLCRGHRRARPGRPRLRGPAGELPFHPPGGPAHRRRLPALGVLRRQGGHAERALGDGRRLAIPLTDGPGYTGAYRGAVRFALFTIADADKDSAPSTRSTPSGMPIGRAGVLCLECADEGEPRPVKVLAAGTGSARVRLGASATLRGSAKPEGCIAFAAAGERMDACTEFQLGRRRPSARASLARAGRRSSTA